MSITVQFGLFFHVTQLSAIKLQLFLLPQDLNFHLSPENSMLTAGNQPKCRQCEQHAGNIRKRTANVCEAMVGVILTFEKVNKIQGCRSCARLHFSVIFIRNVFQFCG